MEGNGRKEKEGNGRKRKEGRRKAKERQRKEQEKEGRRRQRKGKGRRKAKEWQRKEKGKGRKEGAVFGKFQSRGELCFRRPKMHFAPCLRLSCHQHGEKFQTRGERCFRDPKTCFPPVETFLSPASGKVSNTGRTVFLGQKMHFAPCLKLSCRQHRPLPGKSFNVFWTQKRVSPRV